MMETRRGLAIVALVISTMAHAAPVSVTGGLVEGVLSNDRDAMVYRGIPFAAPPLGPLRWRPPAPVVPWQGVRDASAAAPACLQNDYGWNRSTYLFGSEDCLTLDVRAPLSPVRPLPVMVWIHGGSNRAGGSDGTVESSITKQGVVLVSVQYRLGVFGFLSRRDLAAEQQGSSGNYGLMDQIAALKWVQANIARFGGDPKNVTVFGESAGSQDVSLLLASPMAQGLFHKAVLQSGTPGFGMSPRSLDEGFDIGAQLDDLLGLTRGVSGLREVSAHALLAADLKLQDAAIWSQDFLWLRPTLDGSVLPKSLEALLRTALRRPVIIGTNRFEFGPAKGSVDVEAYARQWFGAKASDALAYYRQEERGPDPRLGHLEGRMGTDVVFRCPANHLASLLASQGWPIWRYEFDVGPDDGTREGGLTSHAFEIGFIFNRKSIGPNKRPIQLQDVWTHFAKTGAPALRGTLDWPDFRSDRPYHVTFDRKGATRGRDLRADICRLTTAI